MARFVLRTALFGLSAASLLLAGCANTVVSPAPIDEIKASPAAKSAKKAPDKPIPMAMPTIDALKGDGLYYFDNAEPSRFFITDAIATNGRRPVKEEFRRGGSHGFTWGSGAAAVLRNGRAMDPKAVESVSVGKNGAVMLHFKPTEKTAGKDAMMLSLKLEAYDLSGLPIGDYLVTRSGKSTPAGYFIAGRYVFPKGSVGYRAVLTTSRDEVIVPTKQAFTGSNSIEAFSKRFTKEIPYCLRYVPGKRAEPIGMRFDEPIVKKTERIKGRMVEKAQSGEVALYPVKKGTLFCEKTSDRPIAEADWTLRWVNGTRTISFEFPESIDANDFGVPRAHRNALRVALAEEKIGRTVKLVPARLWLKNRPITDYQWRFNRTAAEAVEAALNATQDRREAWEAKQKRPQAKK